MGKGKKPKVKVFGCPLDGPTIPPLPQKFVDYYNARGCTAEGLFRITGNIDSVEKLKKKLEKGKDVDVMKENPHVIASLFKLYFRELPEPLFTFPAYEKFISAADIEDDSEAVETINDILESIPLANRLLVRFLFLFLDRVCQHSNENKMHANNLAIVFAPTLLRPMNCNSLVSSSSNAGRVVELMISNAPEIFKDPPSVTKIIPSRIITKRHTLSTSFSVPDSLSAAAGSPSIPLRSTEKLARVLAPDRPPRPASTQVGKPDPPPRRDRPTSCGLTKSTNDTPLRNRSRTSGDYTGTFTKPHPPPRNLPFRTAIPSSTIGSPPKASSLPPKPIRPVVNVKPNGNPPSAPISRTPAPRGGSPLIPPKAVRPPARPNAPPPRPVVPPPRPNAPPRR